jgi:TetR/AcrR family fatty acid metabolism transcriptional regulator
MPKIVDKEAKKMEILHAAMQVFAKKGVVNTKMIDIATTASVGKGTIYEYFRSKEEIFASSYIYFFSMTKSMVQEALSKEDDPLAQLELILTISLDAFMHLGEEYANIMMDFWAEGIRTKNQDLLDAINLKGIYEDYRKMIQQILEKGIEKGVLKTMDTKSTASVLIGAFDGILLQWIMDRESIDLKKVPTILLNGFIEGIRKKD